MSTEMTAAEALKAVRNATIYHSKRYPLPTTLMPDGGGYFIDDAVFDGLVAALPTLRAAVEERDALKRQHVDLGLYATKAVGERNAELAALRSELARVREALEVCHVEIERAVFELGPALERARAALPPAAPQEETT